MQNSAFAPQIMQGAFFLGAGLDNVSSSLSSNFFFSLTAMKMKVCCG
jgi:hypothetical protein